MDIPSVIHPSWHTMLAGAFSSPLMLRTRQVLEKTEAFPKGRDVFKVFRMPKDDVRIVILGQDPYPFEGQATGLAFAVPRHKKKPYSLRILEKEIGESVERTLEGWEEQGVFLLNTSLTVAPGLPDSHHNYRIGNTIVSLWEWFTGGVVKRLSEEKPLIWMLWGGRAKSYQKYITNPVGEDSSAIFSNHILKAAHPASERHRYGGFLGCGHFETANRILESKNQASIDWQKIHIYDGQTT